MSANADRYNCETLEIALLVGNAALAPVAAAIFHSDKAEQASATNVDRIAVQAMPRTILVPGLAEGSAKLYACVVKVTLYLATNDPAAMSQYSAGIEAANNSAPSGWIALAQSLFPNGGPLVYETDDGDRTLEANVRTFTKSFQFIFNA